MDLGWIVTFAAPANPNAQVTLLRKTDLAERQPDISIEVDDIDAVYAQAVARGLQMVHPLTEVTVKPTAREVYEESGRDPEKRSYYMSLAPGFFDGQPVLQGKLVLLRPLQAADYQDLYAVAADPLIWEQHPARDRYQEAVFRRFFQEAVASGGALIAIDRAASRIIGSSRFYGYDEENSAIEIGWSFLARSPSGGRYNREIKRLMLRHAFRFVSNVIFFVDHQTFRSQRAVESIGGVLGELDQAAAAGRLLSTASLEQASCLQVRSKSSGRAAVCAGNAARRRRPEGGH
jgi:RimJ/RimL family protein N-acetyltransferase